jgi:hypothetical protein
MGAAKGHDPSAGTKLFEQGMSLVGVPAGCATAATVGALTVTGSSVPPGTRRTLRLYEGARTNIQSAP